MKNSIKLIAAAALVATSGFASAAIDTGATGNGELFFYSVDTVTKNAYYFDTGLTMSSLTPTAATGAAFSLTGFSSYLASVDKSTTVWSVLAADGIAPLNFYTTTFSPVSANPIAKNIPTIRAGITNAANDANLNAIDPSVANGYSLKTASTDRLGSGLNFFGFLPAAAAGNVVTDATANFYNFGIVNNAASRTQFDNGNGASTWNLNSTTGTLSFVTAPVPEPSTYALAIAGLAVVGALARRKKAAK